MQSQSLEFLPVLSASFSVQEEESKHYTIKHVCIGSYSRGCTFTICSCYGNPFSLQVSCEPLPHSSRVPCHVQKRALIYFIKSRVRWGFCFLFVYFFYEKVCCSVSKSFWIIYRTSNNYIYSWETRQFLAVTLHLCPVFTQHACPLILFLKFSLF